MSCVNLVNYLSVWEQVITLAVRKGVVSMLSTLWGLLRLINTTENESWGLVGILANEYDPLKICLLAQLILVRTYSVKIFFDASGLVSKIPCLGFLLCFPFSAKQKALLCHRFLPIRVIQIYLLTIHHSSANVGPLIQFF